MAKNDDMDDLNEAPPLDEEVGTGGDHAAHRSEGSSRKDWGTSITVGGTVYAVGLFWQPLQDPDNPLDEIRDTAEGTLEGADLYCIKNAGAQQYGLGISVEGHKSGMPAAAPALADTLSDRTSSVSVFKVPEGWWFVAIRNDLILPEDDVLYKDEEDAKKTFFSMMAVPDWGRKIAPAEWGVEGTEEADLEGILRRGKTAKLQKVGSAHGKKIAIVGAVLLGAVLIAVFYLLSSLFTSAPAPQPVITPIAKPKAEPPPPPPPPPWEDLADPSDIVNDCADRVAKARSFAIPGWELTSAACNAFAMTSNWTAAFGRIAWFGKGFDDLKLGASFRKSMGEDGRNASISSDFSKVRRLNAAPAYSITELKHELTDIFNSVATSVQLGVETEGQTADPVNPNAPPRPAYRYMKFSFTSTYDPTFWKPFVTTFPALDLQSINFNAKDRTWKYEGRIYERKGL